MHAQSLTICILCLPQGARLCHFNNFCGQAAAFMFLSETMTSLKRNAMNQLPLDLQLPTILSQPNVAFHLLPLSGGTPKAPSATKASNSKKRSRSPANSNQPKAKEDQKVVQAKAVSQTFQQASSTKHWRLHRSNTCAAHTICSKSIHLCAEPGASNPTLFKTIVGDHSFTHSWSFSGKQSQVFALEIFAGTARLTACLRSLGSVDRVGIDAQCQLA